MSSPRKAFFSTLSVCGLAVLATLLLDWSSASTARHTAYLCYLALSLVYIGYRAVRLHLDRAETRQRDAEQKAGLYLRTIETLAVAIEAKDHNTHDHLQRVQVYALEIGKELGLNAREMEALRAASILHDTGKLAVPEHILSKPGKLTPEEFDKMKIHPVVGAEILERVGFPHDVVPIVRAHHERWDGTGYPDGLKAEAIPLGARILGVVDALDALASHRQYRAALPLDEAMKEIIAEAGVSFDPRVVDVLARRYRELEERALASSRVKTKLSVDLKVPNGAAPGAGYERHSAEPRSAIADHVAAEAAARQEVQSLFDLAQALGTSLSLDDTLAMLDTRLKNMIPHDALAVYLRRGTTLVPRYVTGECSSALRTLDIPWGEGLCGWVWANRRPLLNGDPSVESGFRAASGAGPLRAALAVPLMGRDDVIGVLALYSMRKDAFTHEHQHSLEAACRKVSYCIETSLQQRESRHFATTDYITGLPNARALFDRLNTELARARRAEQPLTLAFCDLDDFRSVNQRFGRPAGDRVMRAVAQALHQGCREYDTLARIGPDEFVLILPGIEPEAAVVAVRHLVQDAVEAGDAACERGVVSLSVGTAHFPQDGTDAEHLLAAASMGLQSTRDFGPRSLAHELAAIDLGSTTIQ